MWNFKSTQKNRKKSKGIYLRCQFVDRLSYKKIPELPNFSFYISHESHYIKNCHPHSPMTTLWIWKKRTVSKCTRKKSQFRWLNRMISVSSLALCSMLCALFFIHSELFLWYKYKTSKIVVVCERRRGLFSSLVSLHCQTVSPILIPCLFW
jgi:hypothetical protein